jgi:hypothetical protein
MSVARRQDLAHALDSQDRRIAGGTEEAVHWLEQDGWGYGVSSLGQINKAWSTALRRESLTFAEEDTELDCSKTLERLKVSRSSE